MEIILILLLILIVFFPKIKNIQNFTTRVNENFTSSIVDPNSNKDIKITNTLNIPEQRISEGKLNAQSSIYATKICLSGDNVDKDNFDINNCILRTDINNIKTEPNYLEEINHGIKLCIGKTCLTKENIQTLHDMSKDSQELNLEAKCHSNNKSCGVIKQYHIPENKIKKAFDKLENIRIRSRIHTNWGSGTLGHYGGHGGCHDDYNLVVNRNPDANVPKSGPYSISKIIRHC